MARYKVILAFLVLVQSSQSFAGGFAERHFWNEFGHKLSLDSLQNYKVFDFFFNSESQSSSGTAIKPADGTFDQRIDPFTTSDTRTFKQRYFVYDDYASAPDAPVIYYICGESDCSQDVFLGVALDYASQFKAHLVTLEHRYYGTSQPFASLDSSSLKYLGTKYALADLANFEDYAKAQWGWTGKWITIGGSYSGALSAFYREKYPQNVVAALASSAPVQARINFELYDYTVFQGAGPECGAAIQSVVAYIEASLNDDLALAAIKKTFQADEIKEPVDFLYVVADMAATAVQYGFKDQFCQTVLQKKDPVSGYLNGYAAAGIAAFASFQMTPLQDSFQSIQSTDPKVYENGVGDRQWFYQSCSEYGYFQTAYHDPKFSARSALIDTAYHLKLCQELFGLPPLDITQTQATYYEPLLDPSASAIIFTNGSTDPWSNLSISSVLGNNTNPNTLSDVIDGGSHCSDMTSVSPSNSAAITTAQDMTMALFKSSLGQK